MVSLTSDDAQLVQQFEECSLPFELWTHCCHVKIAYLYLRTFPFDEALDRIRSGIQRYNAANHVPEGPTTGYHETTTQAFVRLIAATMHAYGEVLVTTDANSFCETHPQLLTRHVLRLFYSPSARTQPRAKSEFVQPDLTAFPPLSTG